LARHGIPTDLPLVVQVSRFDKWKDPRGVIEPAESRAGPRTLRWSWLAAPRTTTPGRAVLEAVQTAAGERIIVLSVTDALLVNALQRRAP